MKNDEKIKSLQQEFDLSIQDIKKMTTGETFGGFLAVDCSKCGTKYNLPIGKNMKQWKCGVCNTINDFNFSYVLIPFNSPDLGPTRHAIEKGLKQKPVKIGDREKKNIKWTEHPCYYRII